MDCINLKNIELPKSITQISTFAFYNCSSLENIILSEGLMYIDAGAFKNCINLKSISIPNSIIVIEIDAFGGCVSLEYNEYENGLYLGNEENPYLVFMGLNDKTVQYCLIHPNTKVIYGFAFPQCKNLISVTIPDGVERINSSSFYNCESLESVVIPNSVIVIERYAFEKSSILTIYCEADNKPSEWDWSWCHRDTPVYWAGQWEYDSNGNPVPLS